MVQYGEKPAEAADRALTTQLSNVERLERKFLDLQSYMGSHWDICIIYEYNVGDAREVKAKPPFADAAFYELSSLPRDLIAEDHLEVLDGLKKGQTD